MMATVSQNSGNAVKASEHAAAAAVAARAGEQGRDFAVMASEVLSLAQRSTKYLQRVKSSRKACSR
jgi:Methyl-accepting chemotaxis protein (MCP) signalling domain